MAPVNARVSVDRHKVPDVTESRTERLARRRSDVQSQLGRLESQLAGLRGLRAGAHDDDEHDPDGAPISQEWSRLEGLRQERRDALAAIDVAAARLEQGVAATCTDCGQRITPGRLEARPEAITCLDCAR